MCSVLNIGQRQWRIKGGGTLGKCQGPRAFGGPADFLGLAVVYGAMFFGTAPHGFWADILYMYRGAGAPRFNIKYESHTFLCN